eukprot:TRINITY_DN19744_c0_g1_i1.p1 TRINITY_DN19744_c0_g1~~TRINITY_DN19744_c0_g1_i1.p1  ORF type:complete len:132 (+),score=46.18 TRINITY_DN19744_c0_g1_i1:114-509(+)
MFCVFFFFKQKTAYEMQRGLVGSEMCIRDRFWAPLSRYAEFDSQYIQENTDLTVFADAPDAGVYLAASSDCRQVFITGHPEYDADTLNNEYQRAHVLCVCLLYTSDAADDTPCVDLGGRRIIKKKKTNKTT